ncbi:type II toxin-antitoxin system VapC family toxin [Herbiconiux moechotypicola]|uniref:Ribonuclease VapC n=1 Tax=Herbiconiux moechotypicola TaxID=637393 RepID=A0ABN3E6R8_9MICO|nr:type II toxin-antitoxin system VapC family toxin [Herbiconiux moechotypicola]MCS5731948.1 type II toxin-antitoxin system VapC family toxin [Herbiconiux moechotypicola]
MIILDTNVISELGRDHATSAAAEWLDRQPRDELYTTAITIGELAYGVARLPASRRRAQYAATLAEILTEAFSGRILPYDHLAAVEFGDLQARRVAIGRPCDEPDVQIAAIAKLHSATIATRNTAHFDHDGVEVVNPWGDGRRGADWQGE